MPIERDCQPLVIAFGRNRDTPPLSIEKIIQFLRSLLAAETVVKSQPIQVPGSVLLYCLAAQSRSKHRAAGAENSSAETLPSSRLSASGRPPGDLLQRRGGRLPSTACGPLSMLRGQLAPEISCCEQAACVGAAGGSPPHPGVRNRRIPPAGRFQHRSPRPSRSDAVKSLQPAGAASRAAGP